LDVVDGMFAAASRVRAISCDAPASSSSVGGAAKHRANAWCS
jgi:hypothetical protein